jgi:uncharacterized membrane protein YbhN (UPF0104 family)
VHRLSPIARRAIKVVATVLILGVIGYFFAQTLIANWAQVSALDLAPKWEMAVALMLFVAAVPITGLLWATIVNRLLPTVRPRRVEAIAVQSASWLLKYIPGQLGALAYKLAWGTRRGVPRAVIGLSFIYENVFLVLAATVPSVVILALAVPFERVSAALSTVVLPVLAVIPLAVISHPAVLSRLVTLPAKRFLREDLELSNFLPAASAIVVQVGFLAPRVLNGVGYLFIVEAVAPAGPTAWVPLAAVYILAGAVGLLAIFVPSGIGVREAVIVAFASLYMPLSTAIVSAVVARLVSTLADIGVGALYLVTRLSLPKAAS